jgi:hypothetical protein
VKFVVGLMIALSASACAFQDRDHRQAATSIFNPVCAPDGSVVRVEFANSSGNFDGITTSHEICPWYKK